VGLFGSDPQVDNDILAVLVTKDKDAQRAIAKVQTTVRRLQQPGEPIKLAAAKGKGASSLVVVGSRASIIAEDGRVRITADLVDITFASYMEPGDNFIYLEGLIDLKAAVAARDTDAMPFVYFRDRATAHAVGAALNRLIVEARPRSIPKLWPSYYEDILTRAGKPVTAEWVSALGETMAYLVGGQISACCGTSADGALFGEFARRFVPATETDDQSSVADEMIDWAWAATPYVHESLVEKVEKHRGNTEFSMLKQPQPPTLEQRRERWNSWTGFRHLSRYTFEDQKHYRYCPR
jgi:hypothetical protein